MPWAERLDSGRWRGCYRNAHGQKRSAPGGPFATKTQALREAGAAEKNQRRLGAVDSHAGKIPWGAWFEEWMAAHHVAPATERTYRTAADLHIGPYWNDKAIRDITLHSARQWVKKLLVDPVPEHPNRRSNQYTGKPRGLHAIRGAVIVLNASLNAAVAAGLLEVNRARGLEWLDLPDGPERFLTREEVEAIAHFLPTDRDRLVLWTAVTTGMRAGELGGLHITRVDLNRRLITVQENWDQWERRMEAVPKDKERRHVPITDELAEMLGHHLDHRPPTKSCGLIHRHSRCPGGDIVFRGPLGGPLSSRDWAAGPFRRALRSAEIEGRVRFHDLRHTAASWLVQAGVPLEVVAEILGHSSLEMTRRYAHLGDTWHDQVRKAMTAKLDRGATRGAAAVSPVAEVTTNGSQGRGTVAS
jgi:integrase